MPFESFAVLQSFFLLPRRPATLHRFDPRLEVGDGGSHPVPRLPSGARAGRFSVTLKHGV